MMFGGPAVTEGLNAKVGDQVYPDPVLLTDTLVIAPVDETPVTLITFVATLKLLAHSKWQGTLCNRHLTKT